VREATRRQVVLAAGAAPLLLGAPRAFAQRRGDAQVVAAAIELEQRAVVAYSALARRGALGATAELFRDQDQAHADALGRQLRRLGGKPPAEPRGPGDVPGLTRALRGDRAAMAGFALQLELTAVASYQRALGELRDRRLLATAAAIMTNQAQHLAVLRQALGRDPAPRAFETGGR
jgi:rubrerythrin